MNGFSSITDALEVLVPPFDDGGDWEGIVLAAMAADAAESRGQRPFWRRRKGLLIAAALVAVLVALLATPAFGVQSFVLDLLGRKNVSFQQSSSAPNEIKKQFEDLAIGAPGRWAPEAIASEARTAGTFVLAGHRRDLWVVPTRRGGYCYEIEHSIGGCRQSAADRHIGGKGQFGVSYTTKQPEQPLPIITRIAGDIETPRAATVTLHYADGTSYDVPFIWVSKPIAAGFFSLDIPSSHRNTGHRLVSVVLQAADGSRLGIQTFPAERRRPRPQLPPSALNTPLGRVLPTAPPVPPSAPLQRGSADGFAVLAGHNGEVQFTEVTKTPALQRLVGHSVSYGCFRLTREFGIFTARGLGNEARFTPKVGFDVSGVGTPFDGCDIEGSAGHLWPDKHGNHSVVEIAFTAAGRAFFADRAAARDLALFVKSRRVHQIREEPSDRALRDLQTTYGTKLADSKIHVRKRGQAELVFSETSTTGKTFSVTTRSGKIVEQNLKPYAFPF